MKIEELAEQKAEEMGVIDREAFLRGFVAGFYFFIKKEAYRHAQDIDKCESDLYRLEKRFGVDFEIDDIWVEV